MTSTLSLGGEGRECADDSNAVCHRRCRGVRTQAGWRLRVPVTFSRALPYMRRPFVLFWSELINPQYKGADDFTVEGHTWASAAPHLAARDYRRDV